MKPLLYIVTIIIFFSACRKRQEIIEPVSTSSFGVFVVNEGNYTWANSSLSFYDLNSGNLKPDIFTEANGIPLGDVAYSMTIYKNKGYVVVNNSGLVYVVDLPDMKFSGKITGFVSPRQMVIVNDSLAYVSDLYNTKISKVNLLTNTISGYINVGCSSENIILNNGKVFVSSWSYNNKLFKLDAFSGNIEDSISIGKQPNSMVFDKNGNLWVLCDGCFSGSPYGVENASLWCINPFELSVIKHLTFNDVQDSPIKLNINSTRDTLYFINESIYKQSIYEENISISEFISSNGKTFYGMNINPVNSDIIVTDAKNYISQGELLIYSKHGELKKSLEVGVNPGWIEIISPNPK